MSFRKEAARRLGRGAAACAVIAALGPALWSGPAAAQLEPDPISARVAEVGIAAALGELEAEASPSAEHRLAIGGLRFLRAVERSLQTRWRIGAQPVEYAPVLRLPLPPNPDPEPFDAGMVETVFKDMRDDLVGAVAALEAIPEEEALSLRIRLADIWLDIDQNGERADAPYAEDLLSISGAAGLGESGVADPAALTVAFDRADVAWLEAYAHLLSGISEMALSLDSRGAIEAAEPGWRAAAEFGEAHDVYGASEWIDQALPLVLMMQGRPDRTHTRAALAHFEAMIEKNRDFWRLVALETDNDAEWIPNPTQSSALGGATLSAEAAAAWREVLADAEAMLKGELLVPHWRYGPDNGVGVNLRKVLEEPRSFDLMLWIQGAGAAPYLERGPLISARSFNNFSRLIQGDAMTYALWLN